jgi:hypothetical protein
MKSFFVFSSLMVLFLLTVAAQYSGCSSYQSSSDYGTTTTTGTTLNPRQASAAGVNFSWSTDGTNLLGTLEAASSSGWVAVGFNGDSMATAGKVVIGMVSAGSTTVQIQTISGRTHSQDSATVIASSGKEEGGTTTITFKARLADLGLTGKVGTTLSVILARNASEDGLTVYHGSNRGSTSITL